MDVAVVVVTRNRCTELLRTLGRLRALPEDPAVVVVDNASDDGTAAAVADAFPDVDLLVAERNLEAAGRNLGVAHATTPVVAFADDDSWWAAGALTRLGDAFAHHPDLGLAAARILVEPGGRLDPTCEAMRRSPLTRRGGAPGPAVLGFLACGAAVRREAFLAAGGFPDRYGTGGEEAPLALRLAAAGWDLRYLDDAVAHHAPSGSRDPRRRRRMVARNDLWTAWGLLPWRDAFELTGAALRAAAGDPDVRAGLVEAVWGAPAILRGRRVVPSSVAADARRLHQ